MWFYSAASETGNRPYLLLPEHSDRPLNIGVSPVPSSSHTVSITTVFQQSALRYRVRDLRSTTAMTGSPMGELTHVVHYH